MEMGWTPISCSFSVSHFFFFSNLTPIKININKLWWGNHIISLEFFSLEELESKNSSTFVKLLLSLLILIRDFLFSVGLNRAGIFP